MCHDIGLDLLYMYMYPVIVSDMSENRMARGAARQWAIVKREILDGIRRNQPAPREQFTAGISVLSGLRPETVTRYLNEMIQAKLIRVRHDGCLQLEESTEAMLGFK